MTASLIAKARSRVETAQAALDAALAAGEPTAAAREALELARSELARLSAETAAQSVGPRVDLDQARRLAASACVDLAGELVGLLDISTGFTEATLPESIAGSLILAQRQQAEHAAAVADHEARLEALRARLAALQAERDQIVARRTEGRTEPGDAAAVTLLDADIGGLRNLLARTAAEAPGPDQSRVAEWERSWDLAIRQERGRILASIAAELDERLAGVQTSIRANGTGPWWKPSVALRTAMTGL